MLGVVNGTDNTMSNCSKLAVAAGVDFEFNALFLILSTLLFMILTAVFYSYHYTKNFILGIHSSIGLLSLCALTTIAADMSVVKGKELWFNIYTLFTEIGIGLLVTVTGSFFFFGEPSKSQVAIGSKHKSVSMIIWFITVPLVILELFAAIVTIFKKEYLKSAIELGCLLHKLVQAGVYHFRLRHSAPLKKKLHGASWYFKIIALFNLSLWLQSIVIPQEGNIEIIESFMGSSVHLLTKLYIAFIIDYRLLCTLLFAEHAIEIDDIPLQRFKVLASLNSAGDNEQQIAIVNKIESTQCKGLGYILGIFILGLQFINVVQYTDIAGSWSNIFGVLPDISVIILGLLLIKQVHHKDQEEFFWRKTDSKAIDVMVLLMGIVAVFFLIVKAFLMFVWASRMCGVPSCHDCCLYLLWNSSKYVARSIAVVFQIFLFFKVTIFFSNQTRIRKASDNYFYIACITLSLLSLFLNSVIDSYNSKIEHIAELNHFSGMISLIYHAGEPLQLGFSLHMVIHFVIINKNLSSKIHAEKCDECDEVNRSSSDDSFEIDKFDEEMNKSAIDNRSGNDLSIFGKELSVINDKLQNNGSYQRNAITSALRNKGNEVDLIKLNTVTQK